MFYLQKVKQISILNKSCLLLFDKITLVKKNAYVILHKKRSNLVVTNAFAPFIVEV